MKALFVAFSLFMVFSIAVLARAHPVQAGSSLPIHNFQQWKVVNLSHIELTVSNCASIYLGTEVEYVNPTDPMEFARVVSRYIPLPISKCRKYDERSLSEVAAVLLVQKAEQDLLNERSKMADPFLFIHWRVVKDLQRGRGMLDGDVDIWLMPAEGLINSNWLQFKNEKVEVEFLTENVGNGQPHNIFSGKKYSIGEAYHIVKVGRDDIIRLLNGEDKNVN